MPFNPKDYPPNWKTEIRPAILARAMNRCEICLVPNKYNVVRGMWGDEPAYQLDCGTIYSANDGSRIGETYVCDLEGKVTFATIVLTIAHIDNPDPMDCRPENLKALCQRCHNKHDAPMRAANRKKNKGMQELF